MRDRGSAMMTTVVSVLILLLISGTFFTITISRYKTESSEEKAIKAFYLAEAGIQYGIAKVLSTDDLTKVKPTSETINNPFEPSYGGSFSIDFEYKESTFIVTSIGEYSGVSRRLKAEYSYPDPPDV